MPEVRLADRDDRERAVRDLDESFLVEAAAGTGKTTLLIDRIMALLESGKTRLSRVVAITFTEKAAGELKIRIRKAIEERVARAAPPDRSTWRAALNELDGMSVGTIHSFCAELIRERPVEAGVEPGFAVADELTSNLLFREAWDEWLAQQMVPDNMPLRRAILLGISCEDRPNRSAGLYSLATTLSQHADLASSLSAIEPPDEERLICLVRELDEVARALGEIEKSCDHDEGDPGSQQIRRITEWVSARRGDDLDSLIPWLRVGPKVNKNAGNKRNWSPPEALRSAKNLFGTFLERVAELRLGVGHRVVCDLLVWLRSFLDRYQQAKALHRVLDFQDLLIRARDMLKRHRAAREHFKLAFDYILVDEFQDTDPLQTEIVFFLCERPGEFASEWDAVRLVPGKLFMVGDPKQSIYGFRRADLQLYGRVRHLIEKSGQILALRVNFRSSPNLTEEVNALFRILMRGQSGDRFEPEHVDLVPHRTLASPAEGVWILTPPESLPGETLNASRWKRLESGAIAACIRRLVDGREVVRDPGGASRSIRFGDIAILLRNTTGLEMLEDALRAYDVPYEVAGGKYYYSRREFQELLTVLRAIENPYDAFNVVHALRSPFFGQSDYDLVEHFAAGGTFHYTEPLPPSCDRLANAFAVLGELHRKRNEWPPARLLDELFQRTQALQIYAMKPHGKQRVANLLKVKDLARGLSSAIVLTFSRFVRWLAQMENMGQDEAESPIAEAPDDDFVSVMTFHKAKGLEFPVVFLAHLAAGSRKDNFCVIDRETGRISLKLGESAMTPDWDDAKDLQSRREDGEARRLLYVAMTRARDRLILPLYWYSERPSEFIGYLSQRYAEGAVNAGARLIPTRLDEITRERRDAFVLPLPSEAQQSPLALAHQADRREWQERVRRRTEALAGGRHIAYATELAAGESRPTIGQEEAATFGTLVHHLLEIVDLSEPSDLEALALAEARRCGCPEEMARRASAVVRRTLESDFFRRRVAKAKEIHREVPFVSCSNGEIVEGRMDMVLIEEDGAVLVDYKTEPATSAEASRRAKAYAAQLQIYASALERVIGRRIKEAFVFFTHTADAIPVPVGQ